MEMTSNCKSKHKNVYWNRKNECWYVEICHVYYGSFKNIDNAVRKRDRMLNLLRSNGYKY